MQPFQLPNPGIENKALRVALSEAISRCQVADSLGAGSQTAVKLKATLTAAIAALDVVIA